MTYHRCHYSGCDNEGSVAIQYLWFCDEHAMAVMKKRSEIIKMHKEKAAKADEIANKRWLAKNQAANEESKKSPQTKEKEARDARIMKLVADDIRAWPKRHPNPLIVDTPPL